MTNRRPIVAGNWKMNTTVAEAVALATSLRTVLHDVGPTEVVLCPPTVSLVSVHGVIHGTHLGLGAQNVHFETHGAHTGEVSVGMVASAGASYVIVGHSERRARFGDADEVVSRKVRAVRTGGLTPIVCVGETLEEYDEGATAAVVTRQVRAALEGIPGADVSGFVIAYEPIWAIGTGRPATPEGANATVGVIRGVVADLYGREIADGMRMQYGGSVTASNAASLFAQPHIDGALVGGASLVADGFSSIVGAASVRVG